MTDEVDPLVAARARAEDLIGQFDQLIGQLRMLFGLPEKTSQEEKSDRQE
jgi:hypothetical protein